MNLLRRIASLPLLRSVLLHPRVRRVLAGLLSVRFLSAAFVTTHPVRLLAREAFRRGRVESYRLRGSGMPVSLQHGRDLEALFEIFVRGEYDPPASLAGRLAAPDVVLDIGANVGMFSAWAAARWPEARITAYEPAPENVRVYRDWAARAAVQTDLVEACAMTQDGPVGFVEGRGGGDHLATADQQPDLTVAGVDVFPDLATAAFVKLDIEGGEWSILSDERLGDLQDLVIVMEYHRNLAPRLPAYDAARSLLEDAGFEVSHHRPNHWGHGTLWACKPGSAG